MISANNILISISHSVILAVSITTDISYLDYNSDNERIYHCGASSKDAGNKVTTISEVSDRQVYHTIVDTLIKNPTLILE